MIFRGRNKRQERQFGAPPKRAASWLRSSALKSGVRQRWLGLGLTAMASAACSSAPEGPIVKWEGPPPKTSFSPPTPNDPGSVPVATGEPASVAVQVLARKNEPISSVQPGSASPVPTPLQPVQIPTMVVFPPPPSDAAAAELKTPPVVAEPTDGSLPLPTPTPNAPVKGEPDIKKSTEVPANNPVMERSSSSFWLWFGLIGTAFSVLSFSTLRRFRQRSWLAGFRNLAVWRILNRRARPTSPVGSVQTPLVLDGLPVNVPLSLYPLLEAPTPKGMRPIRDAKYPDLNIFNFSESRQARKNVDGFLTKLTSVLKKMPKAFPITDICIFPNLGIFVNSEGIAMANIRAFIVPIHQRLLVSEKVFQDEVATTKFLSDLEARIEKSQERIAAGDQGRTVKAVERAKGHGLWTPGGVGDARGTYAGRRIIGRGIAVTGGVYLSGGKGRPAIVVDPRNDVDLERVDLEMLRQVCGLTSPNVANILKTLFHFALKIMPYRHVDSLVMQQAAIGVDQNVNLGKYLTVKLPDGSQGGGVCAHMALLVVHWLEILIEKNILRGKASFERNQVGFGKHAWATFFPDEDDAYVIDCAQGQCDKNKNLDNWPYDIYSSLLGDLSEPF